MTEIISKQVSEGLLAYGMISVWNRTARLYLRPSRTPETNPYAITPNSMQMSLMPASWKRFLSINNSVQHIRQRKTIIQYHFSFAFQTPYFSKLLRVCHLLLHLSNKMTNRPFPSSLVPLFQSESKSEAILMKVIFMSLICMKMKLHAEIIFISKVLHLNSF